MGNGGQAMTKVERTTRDKLLGILKPLLWLVIIALAVIWAGRLLINAYPIIALWWFALIALPAAWALFVLRIFQRSIYGFVEVVVGIFTVTYIYVASDEGVMSDTKSLLAI